MARKTKEYKKISLKNGAVRYEFDVSLGFDAKGNRKRTTIRANSIKEGREKVAKLQLGYKEIASKDTLTFHEAYIMYENYYTSRKANLSDTTVFVKKKRYNLYIKNFFDDMKIVRINKKDIEKWHDHLSKSKLKDITINTLERELAAIFNWYVKNELLTTSPMINYEKTKIPKKIMKFWTEEEFKKFIHEIDNPMHKNMYTLLFYTGLRVGELLGLQYEDVQGNMLVLSHTLKYTKERGYYLSEQFKTENSRRVVPFPVWIDLGKGTGRIFPVTFTAVKDVKDRAAKRAGVKNIRVHDFRHSYASMMINRGVEPFTLMNLLGHESITTTMNVYGHLYDEKLRGISNMFGSEKPF